METAVSLIIILFSTATYWVDLFVHLNNVIAVKDFICRKKGGGA